MEATKLTQADVLRAQQIWAEYQKQHDLSSRKGQVAGIDPASGRIWFGAWPTDIVEQMEAEDAFRPLYYLRVGRDYLIRKGGRR